MKGEGVVGHVILNLLCQMEGVDHVFSNHRIFKCSGPTEGRLYFLTSQTQNRSCKT